MHGSPILYVSIGLHFSSNTHASCLAPANVAIEYQKEFTIFNGTFDFPSIYRGEPTPERDEAWHRISKGGKYTMKSAPILYS
jgi:hypothetical protein